MIYVVTHKAFCKPDLENYKSILVGASSNNDIIADYYDNAGNNISEKNKNYCELTGIYWIWKNQLYDSYVGICHYRRYFSTSFFSNSERYYITDKEIETILSDYDVILPNKFCMTKKMEDYLTDAPSNNDMEMVKEHLKKLYPDYLQDFESMMKGNYFYPYNMFIMKKNNFDSYCNWLFTLLFDVEKDYGVPYDDSYRQRLYGFISERLLYVWIKHNIDRSKIKEMRVFMCGEGIVKNLRHFFGRIFHNTIYRIYNRSKLN